MGIVATSDAQQSTPMVRKNLRKQRSARSVRKEQTFPTRELEEVSLEAACSAAKQPQEQERGETEIIYESETTWSLSLSKLQDAERWHLPSRHANYHLLSLVLGYWGQQDLESQEARQLASLLGSRGSTQGSEKGQQICSFWRWLLSHKVSPWRRFWKRPRQAEHNWGRYPVAEGTGCGRGDLQQPGQQPAIQRPLWSPVHGVCVGKFVRSTPMLYVNTGKKGLNRHWGTICDRLAGQPRRPEENLSSSWIN